MNRRTLITGLISFIAAPAIVRADSLMPIKSIAAWTATPPQRRFVFIDKFGKVWSTPIIGRALTAAESSNSNWSKCDYPFSNANEMTSAQKIALAPLVRAEKLSSEIVCHGSVADFLASDFFNRARLVKNEQHPS